VRDLVPHVAVETPVSLSRLQLERGCRVGALPPLSGSRILTCGWLGDLGWLHLSDLSFSCQIPAKITDRGLSSCLSLDKSSCFR